MDKYCEECHDGEGNCMYPFYGEGPRIIGWVGDDPIIYLAEELKEWPDNFYADSEYEYTTDEKNCFGVWTHCIVCGAKEY